MERKIEVSITIDEFLATLNPIDIANYLKRLNQTDLLNLLFCLDDESASKIRAGLDRYFPIKKVK